MQARIGKAGAGASNGSIRPSVREIIGKQVSSPAAATHRSHREGRMSIEQVGAALLIGFGAWALYKINREFNELERMKRIKHEWEMLERARIANKRKG